MKFKGSFEVNGLSEMWPQVVCFGLALIVFLEIVWLTAAQYLAYNNTSTDLSSMSQAIWSVTQGKPLMFTIEGVAISRLARHVEVIYFLLAPLYALWPSPITLLVVQAFLYVSGVIPVYRLAQRHLNHAGATVAFVIVYLFYPVAQTAVLFDLHGDTLAMPLLLWALESMDRQAWRSYTVWIILALSCKFYVAIVVVAMGLVLWAQGKRRPGAATIILALFWGGLAFFVVRPLFASVSPRIVEAQTTVGGYIAYYFGEIDHLIETGIHRLLVAIVVYIPALFLGRRTPAWLLVASLTALPALISNGPGPSYHYSYHHYALSVPFFMVAIIYGAKSLRLEQRQSPSQFPRMPHVLWVFVFITVIVTLAFNSLFVNSPLNFQFYRLSLGGSQGLNLSRYQVTPRDGMKSRWLAENVPEQISVATNALMVPHLINRPTIYITNRATINQLKSLEEKLSEVDYVVIDALFDYAIGDINQIHVGGVAYEHEFLAMLLQHPEFELVRARDGLLVFNRTLDGLLQEVSVRPYDVSVEPQAVFGGKIGLIKTEITELSRNKSGEQRFQIRSEWIALEDLSANPPLFAVSHIPGIDNARIVHLPTMGLFPSSVWQSDQVVQETLEFTVPGDSPSGDYPIFVGWYDSQNLFAADTDARSRIGELVQIGVIQVR